MSDYWSAEYKAALIEDLNDALDNAATLRKRADKLERLLLDLTIGGSEFVGNPEYCAEWIRQRMRSAGKLALERNRLKAKGVLLATALETLVNIAEEILVETGSDKIIAALKQAHKALSRWQDKEATE